MPDLVEDKKEEAAQNPDESGNLPVNETVEEGLPNASTFAARHESGISEIQDTGESSDYSEPQKELYAEPRAAVPIYLGEEPFFSHVDGELVEPGTGGVDGKTAAESEVERDGDSGVGQFPLPEGNVVGVKVRPAGQVFFYDGGKESLKVGSKVIIEQEHGPSMGEVVVVLTPESVSRPQKLSLEGRIESLATAKDIAKSTENSLLAAEASAFCKTCIRQRNLDMKLVEVEVLHDRSKIIFYFTAPTRIDFRELVKDLVRNYRTRIELRQVGVRHETQMIGGIGNCGSVCCCHRFLRKFAPVTIKMAKEQNLFLNPAKLSGMCGRLLCCLSYEQGNYELFNKRAPKAGKKYSTSRGAIKVLRTNMFKQTIICLSETNEELEFSLEDWENLKPGKLESVTDNRHPQDESPRGGGASWYSSQMEPGEQVSLDELAKDDEFEPQPDTQRDRRQGGHSGQRHNYNRPDRPDSRNDSRQGNARQKKRREPETNGPSARPQGQNQQGTNSPGSLRSGSNAERARDRRPKGPRPQQGGSRQDVKSEKN